MELMKDQGRGILAEFEMAGVFSERGEGLDERMSSWAGREA